MKKYCSIAAILFFIFFISGFIATLLADNREIIEFNESWKFFKGDPADAHLRNYPDTSWETIHLPHTWNDIDGQDGGGDYYRGIGWYRKNTTFVAEDSTKKIFIRFGSVNLQSTFYVNGVLIGDHTGGYSAFIFDITEAIIWGEENVFAVKVSNQASIDAPPLSADFTFFGGITRTVNIIKTNLLHISPLDYASSGVYLSTTNVTNSSANLNITALVKNDYEAVRNPTIIAAVYDANDIIIQQMSSTESIPAGERLDMVFTTTISNPHLWNGRIDPYLYNVTVKIEYGGIELDQINQNIGFRYFHVDPDSGFYLNGSRYPLHGVAFHEDRPDKGRAIDDKDRQEDLELLYNMGCTYLRLSHYQHGQLTYNYCDQQGLILWTEIPLINNINNSATFTANTQQQLYELIKQNFNHPSVFFWGLFNEINYQVGPDPYILVQQLNTVAHSLDSIRLTTGAAMFDNRSTNWVPDLISWNKYFGWYYGNYTDFAPWADGIHSSYPDSKVGVSEYGVGANVLQHEENPYQPLHYGGFHPEEYQNLFHETYWNAMKERPYLWSTSVWVGFDFASDGRNEGGNPGINDKGLITRDRAILKDAYFLYKAHWSDDSVLYISSRRFTEHPDSLVEVKTYSNCDSVELFVNQHTMGVVTSTDHIFKWSNVKIDSNANEIKVAGYVGDNILYDSCIWKYVEGGGSTPPDSIYPGDIQINFQTGSTQTPSDYLADIGYAFGERGNGYSYGWDASNTSNARQRNNHDDVRFDTFNHMQRGATRYWEIEIENGNYLVGIVSGDPSYFDSYHKIEVEGRLILEGQPNPEFPFIFGMDTVTISDGRMTVKAASGSNNTKICFIHISSSVTGLDQSEKNDISLPLKAVLHPNFPNPFNPATTINYELKTKSEVQLHIYDITGRKIKTLVNQWQTAGVHSITFDAPDLASGIYIYKLKAGSFEQSRKMLLLR